MAHLGFDSDETDSDSDSDITTKLEIADTENYINDAKSTIFNHEEINTPNALELNKKFQEILNILKSKLENLLIQCQSKYAANEALVQKLQNTKLTTAKPTRQLSYYFCGKPFFKDKNLYSALPNPDYLYRKNRLKEFFPIDYINNYVSWVAKDKIFLIQGVKSQLIKQLLSIKRDQARASKSNQKKPAPGASKERHDLIADSKSYEKMRLSELYTMIEGHKFNIDWFSISTECLDGRHTPNECMGIWNVFLNPQLNRKPWTKDEEQKLIELVGAYNCQNWDGIATHLAGRSGYQCLVQYQSTLSEKNLTKSSKWTKEEDELLLNIIEKCRIGSLIPWSSVVEKVPGRTKAQIYNRYTWTLKPGIKKEKFSIEEDCILMAAIKEYGPNFNKFPSHLLPGRTPVQIRNRYNNVLKFVGKSKNWTEADDQKLLDLVHQYGNTDWRSISDELQTHTRFSCRSRYLTITKFLEKNPKSTVKDVPRKRKPFSTNVTEDNWMETIINVKQYGTAQNPTDKSDDETKTVRPYRSIYSDFNDFFKYSYKFRYETVYPHETRTTETSHAVSQLLRNNICPQDYKILTDIDGVPMDMEYKHFPERDNHDLYLPPSWSTATLLRGLSIMFPKVQKYKATSQLAAVQHSGEESIKLFKQRLETLLYSTMLVAKLKYSKDMDDDDSAKAQTTEICEIEEVNGVTDDDDIVIHSENEQKFSSFRTSDGNEVEVFEDENGECNVKVSTNNIKMDKSEETFYYEIPSGDGCFRISLLNSDSDASTSGKRKLVKMEKDNVIETKKGRFD